ncbi:MAG: TetR/AcrR family transcriptional regulator [Flavobacteriaceae bacterium]|nr:TetR/AcrR family transcriptional regulator [Flavobacteriaceae bacterium]
METTKTLNKEKLIAFYMDFILDEQHSPSSVHAFAKAHKFEETEFYKYFGSLNALEYAILPYFMEHSLSLIKQSEDFDNYEDKHKLLSLYYTFFEQLTMNRSFIKLFLTSENTLFKNTKKLKPLRTQYLKFINQLDISKSKINQERLDNLRIKSVGESFWLLFLSIFKFWYDDNSANLEKTDLYIEKSVHASFDLADTKPIKSILDFGKFILKEQLNIEV